MKKVSSESKLEDFNQMIQFLKKHKKSAYTKLKKVQDIENESVKKTLVQRPEVCNLVKSVYNLQQLKSRQ